jgi:hypothetical protein
VATQTNNYRGARPKISQRRRLCTLNHTYSLDYISNNLGYISNYLDSRVLKEKQERSHREELGKELGLGLTSQNNLDYLQFFVNYLNYN